MITCLIRRRLAVVEKKSGWLKVRILVCVKIVFMAWNTPVQMADSGKITSCNLVIKKEMRGQKFLKYSINLGNLI